MPKDQPVQIGQILNSLSSRDLRNVRVVEQLSSIRTKLDLVEQTAKKDGDLSLGFASHVLHEAIDSGNQGARDFAATFISHLGSHQPTSSFLDVHPEFKELDLGWFIDTNPDYKDLLEPVREISLVELMSSLLSERLDGPVPKPKKDKGSKREEAKNDKKQGLVSFDDVRNLHPIISNLFDNDTHWVPQKGGRYLSFKVLCGLFEKISPSGDKEKDDLAVYQSITSPTGLISKFLEADTQGHKKSDIISIEGQGKARFYPETFVADFLVFAADKLSSSSRIDIQIRRGSELKVDIRKKK